MAHHLHHLSPLLHAQTYWPSEGAVFKSSVSEDLQNAKVLKAETEQFCCYLFCRNKVFLTI
jgi:hypothetical protein